MSKTIKDKNKPKVSTTTSITRKSTIGSTSSNAKTPGKKLVTETKIKSVKPPDEKVVRRIPNGTRASTTLRIKPNFIPKTIDTGNQEVSNLKKRQSEEKTATTIVRPKTTLKKAEAPRVHSINANTGLKRVKPNAVLDTYHNVTVSSPPPTPKKELQKTEASENVIDFKETPESNEKRTRTRTRTLDPDEVVVLRNESAKQRIQAEIQAQNFSQVIQREQVKDAVAFEVNFEKPVPPTHNRNHSKTRIKQENPNSGEDVEAHYSDDFESYESDFETGSSPTNSTESEDNQDETDSSEEDEASKNGKDSLQNTDNESQEDNVEDDESELTQYPITVIQREKEFERKLDSGNYEMHSSKQGKPMENTVILQQQFDSLDTFSGAASEQLDSGISSYGNATQNTEKTELKDTVFYGGYADFNTRPILNQRGFDLMSKIQFDTLDFTLFELKPIIYEVFMQTYGRLNSTQSSTQTNENRMSTETQTEDYEVRSMWTQHPAQYDLQTVQKLSVVDHVTTQNCCGEFDQFNTGLQFSRMDKLDGALQNLVDFRQNGKDRGINKALYGIRKPIDFDKLRSFMMTSSTAVLKVLNYRNADQNFDTGLQKENTECVSFSCGYNKLNTGFLNALRVVRVFSNSRHNLVVTVHESLPEADVYQSEFSNLLMVWSTSELSKPIRLLSVWSEVYRAEICSETSDIVVCGLRDGSVAMWDLRETYSFCSKLDGYLTHFAATQSIIPMWNTNEGRTEKLIDMGAIVDVRSFRSRPEVGGLSNTLIKYKSIQFASINEAGVITIWTLVETTPNKQELPIVPPSKGSRKIRTPMSPNARSEYISPWARVKLIQSAICDLRAHLEYGIFKSQSNFDRTKSLFEKNIYNDEILRELNETQSDLVRGNTQLQGLRFTCINTGCELIYVCTNRNFILICSKSLKTEKFRKISINEDRFLFPTALCVLSNDDFLAVGLSNGSVMILNCNQNKTNQQKPRIDKDSQGKHKPSKLMKLHEVQNIDLETGKSCAIQNIILSERRSFDNDLSTDYDTNHDSRPNTAAFIGLISNEKKPFELQVFDQQIILSGSMLRRDLVQSLELSSDGWRIFALSDGEVRTYDFCLDREITGNSSASKEDKKWKAADIAVAKTSQTQQNLIALTENGDVEVHVLKL